MTLTRRTFTRSLGAAGLAAAVPQIAAPALAQQRRVRIGILAPRSGVAGTAGECGLRAAQWAAERMNKDGGIAGRKIELVVEEETSPKDTIERFRRLVLQEKVDCTQGLISTGVSLGVAPAAEEERALLVMWDGTTQDGVKEVMPNPRYVFRSTDNECEAVMGSLLAVKYWKGQFKTIAGINPDYSYGRNNWEAFRQILARYGVEAQVVVEQSRLHGGARRERHFRRPCHRRARLRPPAGHGDVGDPILALRHGRRAHPARGVPAPGSCWRRRRSRGALRLAQVRPMTALLQTLSVSKHYGAYRALSEVSVRVDDGEFVSIVGPNGAGKTTLVNVITGLLKPTAGAVRFRGSDIAGIGPVELARRGMARAFQLVNIFPGLTVGETLGVAVSSKLGRVANPFRSFRRDAELHGRIERVAEVLGLRTKLETTASTLSQGEKKLLDVASAFALEPEVILLDEPTSGVSTGEKHAIMDVLVGAARAAGVRAIIQVEHDMDLVARYSHRIVALQEGRVLADLPPDRFFSDPALAAAVVGTKPPTLRRAAGC